MMFLKSCDTDHKPQQRGGGRTNENASDEDIFQAPVCLSVWVCSGMTGVNQRSEERGKITASMAKIIARLGKIIARMGKIIARMGKTIARMGKTIARMGKVVVRMGKITARMGRITARMGK